jgi:hypothetical protein
MSLQIRRFSSGGSGAGRHIYVVMTTQAARFRISAQTGIKLLIIAGVLCAVAGLALLPRALEAESLVVIQDDPVELADKQLTRTFNAEGATREIEAALAAKDVDLARSFVELAQERSVPLDPALVAKVEAARAAADTPSAKATAFAKGFISGEPDDMVSLAGTALGDLFVFGDIRDAVREGSRWAAGEKVDHLILGLSAVGLAITAGTYATLGTGAPARIGLSVVKAARKTGRLGTRLGEWMTRSMRDAVEWTALRKGLAGASLTTPAVAVRGAREAVKVEKAGGLLTMIKDVGRVQAKAGTAGALDALKLAETPKEIGRVAKLAEKQGGKTRAVLKYLGRGAIALSVAAFDLALWIFGALLMVFGFVWSAKGAVERATKRHLQRKKSKKLAARERDLAARERALALGAVKA